MIDLSENTNRWGMPPASRRVLLEAGISSAYPEAGAPSLRRAISAYVGADPGGIVCGCGSDDVLDAAISALLQPGDLIAIPEPTFRMVPLFARARGLLVAATAPRADLTVDVDAVVACRPRMVYLASPCNPTGITTSLADVERLLAATGAFVIVDEAYIEFGGVSALALLDRYPRLLVVRTFSKAFGLASLRVGYAVGTPDTVRAIAAVRGPYQVSAPASRAAIAALDEGLPWVRQTAAYAVHSREVLSDELRASGLPVVPSQGNFVLAPIAGATDVANAMRARGVAVRAFTALPGVGDALRITAAPWEEMSAATSALAASLERGQERAGAGACA